MPDRLDIGAAVSVSGNSDDQWQITMSQGDWLRGQLQNHPLLALWAPLLLLPGLASLLGRRYRHRRSRHAHPPQLGRAHPAEETESANPHADSSTTQASVP